jgi:hypothetical protein
VPEGGPVSQEEERALLETELEQLAPGWTLKQFADLEALLPEDRALELKSLEALGKLSWTKQTTTFERVMAILNLLAAIASPIATIAGGFGGVEADLKAL